MSKRSGTPTLDIKSVHKAFGSYVAVENVDLEIWPGEFIALIGHSGCGKSTLLNMISGLEKPSNGHIRLNGRSIEGPGPDRAMVFQNYSLLPWLSVFQNVLEAVKAAQPELGAAERKARVEEFLSVVGLMPHKDKKPSELSGGMKQRVAIARAFAIHPSVLLLDEPFGALDAITKSNLHEELLKMWSLENTDGSQKNVVMVTHDIDEAIYLADRIVVMSNGPKARIHEIIEVPLARPRSKAELIEDPTYLKIKAHLLSLLSVVLAHPA
ncbi:ABC transporter ATP-binding protein [Deinococcus misasensis]|uniref:ABC transporter ATP-binding protein n=1 Tax=Deinococcus misasensis TaxID=392413 RepID=UPI00055821C9|nr:ABC transporter ATP-binding protein [Deinococcus misasensis]